MSYGDQGYRYRADGFRDDSDLGDSATSYQPGYASTGDLGPGESLTGQTGPVRRTVTPAELDDVFDDPQYGDPGMDRMLVHVVWEVILLVAAVGLAYWFHRTHPAGITGTGLRDLLMAAASLGFVTVGMAMTLRVGSVNLALGPIAAFAGLFYATHSDKGLLTGAGMAVGAALAAGLVIGVLVAVLHVPGWAASLAGALAVIVWIQKHIGTFKVPAGTYQPTNHAYYWFGVFAALSLVGGTLGLIKPIRRGVGRFRPTGDPAQRRGRGAALLVVAANTAAATLAGLAGVLAVLSARSATPTDGIAVTGLALAAALGGGTSAFGRRGGVLGTVLGVSLVTLVIKYGVSAKLRMSDLAVAAGGIVIGLLVTRLIEAYGRPRVTGQGGVDEWGDASGGTDEALGTSWSTNRQTSGWTSQLPARSTDDTWGGASDDRWGTR